MPKVKGESSRWHGGTVQGEGHKAEVKVKAMMTQGQRSGTVVKGKVMEIHDSFYARHMW